MKKIVYQEIFVLGIAVCGSGVGCFVFAPLANILLDHYGLKGTIMIFAALCFNCAICGALMRPLELISKTPENPDSPLLMVNEISEPHQMKQMLWEEAPALKEEDEAQ